MGDAEKNLSSKNQEFLTPKDNGSGNPFWISLAMGVTFLALVAAAVFFFGRNKPDPNAHKDDPYLANLKISELHISLGEDFAGNRITYIEGKITNAGDKKVTGATMELRFKNVLGETTQQENLPVMVLLFKLPYEDYGSLEQAPLAPGQIREFRLTLEHITADWDRQLPQVKMVSVKY
jgi:hypothetical protein